MGGRLKVVNDPGGGAVFTLRVPVEFAAEPSHEHGNANANRTGD